MAKKITKTEKGQPDDELRSRPPAPNQKRLPLHGLHDEQFEEILADMAENEPGIARAEMKRISGVAQFGVDVEGFSEDQKPTLVISCKRYKHVQPAELTNWSTDFLKHLDGHWKGKGVERFALAVSIELNSDDLNDRIAVEAARFKAKGIQYEVWGLKKLTDKLRPLQFAILKFFQPGWLEAIGASPAIVATTSLLASSTSTASSAATASVAQSLHGVSEAVRLRLGSATAGRLDGALQHLREGIAMPLRSLVDEIRQDRLSWDALTDDVKAKFLRAEGSLAIRGDDLATATARYEEADVYAPPPDRTAAALLARLKLTPQAALEEVIDPTTSAEAGMRAGLFIETGMPDKAIETLDAWPHTSPTDDAYEPKRLRSIALLWKDRTAALEVAKDAETLAPRQFALQWAAAVVRFNFALSGKAYPVLSSFPNPLPQGLVRDTDDARQALDEAERIFGLLARTIDDPDQAADMRVWRLACLILNPRRNVDAGELAAKLADGPDLHPGAIVWATSAGLTFNYDDAARAINAKLRSGAGDASDAVALAYLTSTRSTNTRAVAALRRHRNLFSSDADIRLIDYWIGLLTSKDGDEIVERFNKALAGLRKAGRTEHLLAMLDGGDLEADMELAAFEHLAINGKWLEIDERRDSLLAFGTSHASEVAIRAAFALNRHRDVIALASDLRDTFHGSRLPTGLGLLVARSQLLQGDAELALRALEEMRNEDGSDELAFEDALMRLRIGDLSGAASVIRGRNAPGGSPEALLKLIPANTSFSR